MSIESILRPILDEVEIAVRDRDMERFSRASARDLENCFRHYGDVYWPEFESYARASHNFAFALTFVISSPSAECSTRLRTLLVELGELKPIHIAIETLEWTEDLSPGLVIRSIDLDGVDTTGAVVWLERISQDLSDKLELFKRKNQERVLLDEFMTFKSQYSATQPHRIKIAFDLQYDSLGKDSLDYRGLDVEGMPLLAATQTLHLAVEWLGAKS